MFDPADRRKQILYKAVAALARRERPRLGLYKKLSETFNEEGDKELINSVLDELVNKKYLSDERYARIQVLTRSARYGDRKLFWNLQRDGVSREIAEEALKQNEESEYDRALVLWKRKFGEPPEDYKERAKQIRFLASRGFTFKTIEKVLNCEVPDEVF